MEEAIMVLYAVVIVIVAAAAIFTGIDVYLSLKTAHGGKPGYFNIWYKPEHGTEFCRAHLVGKVDWRGDKVLYVVEIHPRDAAKALAWTALETELFGGHLLEKGKFYSLASKEELYD